MEATETDLTIFGWAPRGTPLVAGGVVIAAVIGAITLATDGQIIHSLITVSLVCLGSALLAWIARLIFRRRPIEQPNDILMLLVAVRIVTLVAVVLLALAALAMFLLGQPSWLNLLRAFFNSMVFGAAVMCLGSVIANLSAFGRVTER